MFLHALLRIRNHLARAALIAGAGSGLSAGNAGATTGVSTQVSTQATTGEVLAARQPRFATAAEIPGRWLPAGAPWSPDGLLLAVVDATGLALWDATHPTAAPRVILDAAVLEVRWSPDGTWLCCRVRVMNATRGGAIRFQFVPAAGGEAEYRVPNAGIGNWTWADDGKVYYWNAQTGVRQAITPPHRWLEAQPPWPARRRPELVIAASGDRRRPRPRPLRFDPGTSPTESLLDSLFAHEAVHVWSRIQANPEDAPRWIVTARDAQHDETILVNQNGGRIRSLQAPGDPPLLEISASADGGLVAGERCAAGDTARACRRIWVGSLEAASFTKTDWDGRAAAVEPQGRWVAFEEQTGRGVRVMRTEPSR